MSILTGMIAPTSGHYNIRYTSEVNQGSRQTDVLTDVQTVTETGANTPLSGPNCAQKHCENHPIDPEINICDGQKKPRTNAQTNILTDKQITRVDIEGQTVRLSKNSADVKYGWVQCVWSVVCSGYKQIVEGDQNDSQNVKSQV